MKALKTAALAALLSTTALGGALAADAITPLPPAPVAQVPVFDEPGFDWAGFYAGVNVGGENNIDTATTNFVLGGQIGANFVYDFFVLGAELGIDAVFDDAETYATGEILARAGVIVTDNLLAYAALGYDTDFDAANGAGDHILAGGGVEFAVTDNVSIDGRYVYGWEQTDAADPASDVHKFTLGANFHF